jgi:hypothetical protein
MATLIIHAPQEKAEQEGSRSFDRTIELRIGEGYAIPKADADRLGPGDKVVVLSKDEKRRAEATLVKLDPSGETDTGMKRYDVHIENVQEVPYEPEPLGRTGVSVV